MSLNTKAHFHGRVLKTTGDSHELPTDPENSPKGSWYVGVPAGAHKHFLVLRFYDGAYNTSEGGNQITPSAGTVTLEVSDDGRTYGAIYNGVIDLSQPYGQISFLGYAHSMRVTVEGLRPSEVSGGDALETTYVVVDIHSFN